MGDYIIVIDREQLKSLIGELISELAPPQQKQPKSDYINIDGLIELLAENGFNSSKTQIYKMTSNNAMPFSKIGNKLLFKRTDIFDWIESHKNTPRRTRNPVKAIQANMRDSTKDG